MFRPQAYTGDRKNTSIRRNCDIRTSNRSRSTETKLNISMRGQKHPVFPNLLKPYHDPDLASQLNVKRSVVVQTAFLPFLVAVPPSTLGCDPLGVPRVTEGRRSSDRVQILIYPSWTHTES
ncbi:hypothetical protein Plhal304r1_c001g0001531 [Plasmopara halstedii]